MAIGFVLISTAPAKEHEVYNELLKVKEIVELHPLFGEYDLIAKVEANDFNVLGRNRHEDPDRHQVLGGTDRHD